MVYQNHQEVIGVKLNVKNNMNKKNSLNWQRRTKEILIQYKGGKCEICGYDKKFSSAYHFHHINPKEKEFNLSSIKSLDKLKAEADKCQLLCVNCHSEIHEIENMKKIEEFEKNYIHLIKRKQKQIERNCLHCGKIFFPKKCNVKLGKGRYCSRNCSSISNRKTNRPTRENFIKMLQENSVKEVASIFNVTGSTVSKWKKSFDI